MNSLLIAFIVKIGNFILPNNLHQPLVGVRWQSVFVVPKRYDCMANRFACVAKTPKELRPQNIGDTWRARVLLKEHHEDRIVQFLSKEEKKHPRVK